MTVIVSLLNMLLRFMVCFMPHLYFNYVNREQQETQRRSLWYTISYCNTVNYKPAQADNVSVALKIWRQTGNQCHKINDKSMLMS